MNAIDTTTDKPFTLAWGELHHAAVGDGEGDYIDTSVATLTLIDNATGEEVDARDLIVRDDDPQADAKLNSEPVYQEVEDTLLTIHNLNRAQVEITTAW